MAETTVGLSRQQGPAQPKRDAAADAMRAMTRKQATTKEAAERNREEDRQQLYAILADHGGGSVFRGWRRELEKDGNFEISFADFVKAAVRLSFYGDMQLLLGNDGDCDTLSLDEVAPVECNLLDDCREWISDTFGSTKDMFIAFAGEEEAELSRNRFLESCHRYGFSRSDEEIDMIYDCIDYIDSGRARRGDVIFLEFDKEVRLHLLFQEKLGKMIEWRRKASNDYIEFSKQRSQQKSDSSFHKSHRLAPRPWMEKYFEHMPTVACASKNYRIFEAFKKARRARNEFKENVRKNYGNEVRAFRRALARDGYHFTRAALRSYLVKHDLHLDVRDLWLGLDRDEDGVVKLEEFCIGNALALGNLMSWARRHPRLGSCSAIWDMPELAAASREITGTWFPGKDSTVSILEKALESIGCPVLQNKKMRQSLWAGLDLQGFGILKKSDLEWLDGWRPMDWIFADPDPEAWEQFKQLLLKTYGHMLKAWRCALDRDDSNTVTWVEFRDACKRLKFNGNVMGAWRVLDDDLSGQVSMNEYDSESYELLKSFKDWTEMHFGSISRCFDTLDDDKSGSLSLVEMRRACRRFHWTGDVKMLFNCLDVDKSRDDDGKRNISREELLFLDSWTIEPSEADLAAADEPPPKPLASIPVSKAAAAISARLASPVNGLDLLEPRPERPPPLTRTELLQRPHTPCSAHPQLGSTISSSASTPTLRSPYSVPLCDGTKSQRRKRLCHRGASQQSLRTH